MNDPEVRARFQPLGVSNIPGGSDFPVLHVVNREDAKAQSMLFRREHGVEATH